MFKMSEIKTVKLLNSKKGCFSQTWGVVGLLKPYEVDVASHCTGAMLGMYLVSFKMFFGTMSKNVSVVCISRDEGRECV